MPSRPTEFQTIRSEGGLLPPDLLRRVVDPAGKVSGVEPTAYGLPAGERLNEAITQGWNRLRRHWAEFRAVCRANSEWRIANGVQGRQDEGNHSPLATHHLPKAKLSPASPTTNGRCRCCANSASVFSPRPPGQPLMARHTRSAASPETPRSTLSVVG